MKYKSLKVDYKTPLKDQLEKLGITNYLDLSKIQNLYLKESVIYDIEDGEEMKGKSPEYCEQEFKKQNRRGLNVHEVLAIIRKNPKVLSNHHIDCVGSRYESAGGVPYVYLDYGDRPRLGWRDVDFSNDYWGSASCGSRTSDVGNLESRVLELEEFKKKVEKVLNL